MYVKIWCPLKFCAIGYNLFCFMVNPNLFKGDFRFHSNVKKTHVTFRYTFHRTRNQEVGKLRKFAITKMSEYSAALHSSGETQICK